MGRTFKHTLIGLLEYDLGINKTKHRHQSDRGGPTLGAKTSLAVPKYLKHDPTDHPKLERLRELPSGKILLNASDVKAISKIYNIKNLSPEEPRECGTTGISIVFDNMTQNYQLVKGR